MVTVRNGRFSGRSSTSRSPPTGGHRHRPWLLLHALCGSRRPCRTYWKTRSIDAPRRPAPRRTADNRQTACHPMRGDRAGGENGWGGGHPNRPTHQLTWTVSDDAVTQVSVGRLDPIAGDRHSTAEPEQESEADQDRGPEEHGPLVQVVRCIRIPVPIGMGGGGGGGRVVLDPSVLLKLEDLSASGAAVVELPLLQPARPPRRRGSPRRRRLELTAAPAPRREEPPPPGQGSRCLTVRPPSRTGDDRKLA